MTDLFNDIIKKAKARGKVRTAVVNPIGEAALGGAIDAMQTGLIDPILLGSRSEIEKSAKDSKLDIGGAEIIDCYSEEEMLKKAVDLCKNGDAKILMKGKIHTDHLMAAVVKRDGGLRTDKHISHIFALSMPTYHKVLYVTDAAINIYPNLEQKEKILRNAIEFVNKTGVQKPKVAVLSAIESVNPKILGSVEAKVLADNPEFRAISTIEGPMAFDNAISKKAAEIKMMKSDVAGDVDLLLLPNLEAGNILFKALVYLAKAEVAGVVLGAEVPIILTSRADDARARLVSSALAILAI